MISKVSYGEVVSGAYVSLRGKTRSTSSMPEALMMVPMQAASSQIIRGNCMFSASQRFTLWQGRKDREEQALAISFELSVCEDDFQCGNQQRSKNCPKMRGHAPYEAHKLVMGGERSSEQMRPSIIARIRPRLGGSWAKFQAPILHGQRPSGPRTLGNFLPEACELWTVEDSRSADKRTGPTQA